MVGQVGVFALDAGLFQDVEDFLLALAFFLDVAVEVGGVVEWVWVDRSFVGGEEIGVGSFGAVLDVIFVGGAGGFGMNGAEVGVGEIERLGDAEEFEIVLQVDEGAAGTDVFEDAGLDGGANGAEEGVGLLFVTDVGGGGELGEQGMVGFGLGGGAEAGERAAGGDDVEAAFGAGAAEELDGFVVGSFGAEIEDEFTVGLGKGGELVFGFIFGFVWGRGCICRIHMG